MDAELINKIAAERRRYVEYFQSSVNSLKKDKVNFAIELPIQTNEEAVSTPFDIVRVDFIAKKENNEDAIFELRLDTVLDFVSKKFFYKNLQINLRPFCWNSCEFQADKIEIGAFKEWIDKWLKIDEDINDGELSKAIHSCTDPETNDGKFSFVIDFGTATEAAFIDFIELLSKSGTTELNIQTIEI